MGRGPGALLLCVCTAIAGATVNSAVSASPPIITMGAYNIGNTAIYSIDRSTGEPLWAFSTKDMGFGGSQGHGWYDTSLGDAPVSLSADGSTVYVVASNQDDPRFPLDAAEWSGRYALDASTGHVRWNISGFHSPPFHVNLTKASTAIVATAETLFQSGGGGAVGYHAANGLLKWSYTISEVWDGQLYPDGMGGYMPPLVPVASNKHSLAVTMDGNGRLHALQADDGSPKWDFAVRGGCPVKPAFLGPISPCGWIRYTTLSETEDVLYVVGFFSVGDPDKNFNNTATLFGLNMGDGSVKWEFPLGVYKAVGGTWDESEPVLSGDGSVIYIQTSDNTRHGRLCAVHAADGKQKWCFSIPLPSDPSETSSGGTPVVAGSAVYFASTDAGLCSLDAETGRLNWSVFNSTTSPGGVGIHGASADANEVYADWDTPVPGRPAESRSYLGGLNAKDGSQVWAIPMSSQETENKQHTAGVAARTPRTTAAASDGSALGWGLGSPVPGGLGQILTGSVRGYGMVSLNDHTVKWRKQLPAAGNEYWDGVSLDECTLCPATWHSDSHCQYGGHPVGSRRCPGTIKCEALCRI